MKLCTSLGTRWYRLSDWKGIPLFRKMSWRGTHVFAVGPILLIWVPRWTINVTRRKAAR